MNAKARSAIALGLIFCGGCTEIRSLQQPETQVWLALHAVDTIQTLDIAHDPHCYEERDGITRSLIGAHPSDGEVLAWSVGMAGLSLGITEVLLRTDHPKLAKVWQYFRIGVTVDAISSNHSIGIRIGSPNKHEGPCIDHAPQLPPPRTTPRPIG